MAPEPRRPDPPLAPEPRPAAPRHLPPAAPVDFPRRRESVPAIQFGMRSLLITISAAAVLLAIGTSIGGEAVTSLIVMVAASVSMVLIPVCFGSLAVYCVGMRRTFFLGALFGCVMPYFGGLGVIWRGSMLGVGGYLAVSIATSLLSGYVAVVTRRYAERRGWHLAGDPAVSAAESPSGK
jgi:hypothetical protein